MFCDNVKKVLNQHLIRSIDQELTDSILPVFLVFCLSVRPSVDPIGMHCVKSACRLAFHTSLVQTLLHGVTVFSPHLFLMAYITSYISVETSRVSWKLGSFDGNGSYFWISSLMQCSILQVCNSCRAATLQPQQCIAAIPKFTQPLLHPTTRTIQLHQLWSVVFTSLLHR